MFKKNSPKQVLKIHFCCKSKELERNKEETKREFRENSDDLHFMLIRYEKDKSLYINDTLIDVHNE